MKIAQLISWFLAAIVLFLLFAVYFNRRSAHVITLTNEYGATNQILSATHTPAANEIIATTSNKIDTVVIPQEKKGGQILENLSSQNNIPIVFYGRVEDQFGNPVSDAQIFASVRVYNGVQSTVERFSVRSDAGGFFNINHGKGESLSLAPKKVGYVLATTGTDFRYSHLDENPYIPNANKPTIVKMHKLQGAEPLVEINTIFKLPCSEESVLLDLLKGSVVSTGGDLEITVTRAPGLISQRKNDHLDWSIKLQPINGGILASDELVFEAPADGYQNNYLVQMRRDDPAWFDNIQKNFFLKSRSGQVYSKINFSFRINNNPDDLMYIKFGGVANTNSSRNWETTAPSQ